MLQGIRGIIWDLDGTLADTLQDITNAANAALSWADLPVCSPEEIRRHVGRGVDVLIRRASGLDDPHRVAELVRVLRDHYREHAFDHTRLYPGIAEVLDVLSAHEDPMCVLSNKPHHFTVMTIDALLSSWSFVQVLGERDDVPRKPDPTAARTLVERMGLTAEAVAMVGDSDVDMQTGRNAGLRCVGATWGFRDRDELVEAGAHTLIDEPAELLPLLGIRD